MFTEFVDTLEMLASVLTEAGWRETLLGPEEGAPPPAGLFVRYEGETPRNQREHIRRRFLEDSSLRILLADDAASESINLHKGCHHLVHYETVWNPNRYEQRNGRIDRYGQVTPPQVYLLLNADSFDERVALVGYNKLEVIAEQLGSVSNVLPLAQRLNIDSFLDEYEEHVAGAGELVERALDEAAANAGEHEDADGTADLVRGESFDAQDLAAVQDALDRTRSFTPAFDDVEAFLRVFLRTEGIRLEPVGGEPGIFSLIVPSGLREEVGAERIERATFRRDVAVLESDREEDQRVHFLSPGHPLVRAALLRARGWVYQPAFESRVGYRRVGPDVSAGFLFTFAQRFLDGRGETIDEAFEPVFVALNGEASRDADADRRLFADPGRGGNATEAEEQALEDRYRLGFEAAADRALAEATRRAECRVRELEGEQQRIVEDALVRLGAWKQASEARLRRRADDGPSQQLLALDDVAEIAKARRELERRRRQFSREQQRLLDDEQRRRDEIRSLRQVRAESIDPIGALALVPEGGPR